MSHQMLLTEFYPDRRLFIIIVIIISYIRLMTVDIRLSLIYMDNRLLILPYSCNIIIIN